MITVNREEAAKLLLEQDKILILMHKSPDGDTVGCGYALAMALRKLGKQAQPVCSDRIPDSYRYFTDFVPEQVFEPQFIVSTDVADTKLLGDKTGVYRDRIDLSIDHHGSNRAFAGYGVTDASAPACAQLMPDIIEAMGVEIDPQIANALFTGLTTDTGCFCYTSVTADTHRTAAYLMDKGADAGMINRLMFETKSRARIELEKLAMASLRFYCGGRLALICITTEMMQQSGAQDNDTESIPSIPRQIEGVQVAVTVKQKGEKDYKISLRTTDEIDASAVCAALGGGGHRAAAGCSFSGSLEEAVETIVGLSAKAIESAAV